MISHSRYIYLKDEKKPYIQTLNLENWSKSDKNSCSNYLGMKSGKKIFEQIKEHLKAVNLLPDEYFICDNDWKDNKLLPDYELAVCNTTFGGSEGIYLDINLIASDFNGNSKSYHFITGKTLGESADDYIKMSRIGTECSMLLNGRGCKLTKQSSEFMLNPEQTQIIKIALNNLKAELQTLNKSNDIINNLVNMFSDVKNTISNNTSIEEFEEEL
jgi:hypothetical protein